MKLKAMSVLVIESRFSEHISDFYSNIIHFVMIYIMVENIFICLCKYRKGAVPHEILSGRSHSYR